MNQSCVSNYIVKIEKAEISGSVQPQGTSACVDAYSASVDSVSTAVKVHASVVIYDLSPVRKGDNRLKSDVFLSTIGCTSYAHTYHCLHKWIYKISVDYIDFLLAM